MFGQAMYAGCGEKAFVWPAKPGLNGRSSFVVCAFGAVPRASYCTDAGMLSQAFTDGFKHEKDDKSIFRLTNDT